MIIQQETYLKHFGKKGMKWGQRKARKTAAKESAQKEYNRQQRVFMNTVMKDVKTRNPNELYAIKGTHGNIITTGKDFVDRVNMGMKFTDLYSTGKTIDQKINW